MLMDYAPGGSLRQACRRPGQAQCRGNRDGPDAHRAGVWPICTAGDSPIRTFRPETCCSPAHGKPLLADLGVARMVGDPPASPEHGTDGFSDPAPVDASGPGCSPGATSMPPAALGWYCLTGAPPLPAPDRPPLSLLVPDVPAMILPRRWRQASARTGGSGRPPRNWPRPSTGAREHFRSTFPAPCTRPSCRSC